MAASSPATAGSSQWETVAYVALILLVFVGFAPFFGGLGALEGNSGDASLPRQLGFSLVCVPIWFLAINRLGSRALQAIPLSTLLVLVWVLLSTSWSASPDVTLRRAVLVVMVTSSACFCVAMLGTERSLRILRNVLAVVILLDLVAVFALPWGQHVYEGEMAWAGLHGHKNTAGAIASLAGMLFLHYVRVEPRWSNVFYLLCTLVFLAGTQSKTAAGILIGLFVVDVIYRFSEKKAGRRRLFRIGFLSLCTAIAVGIYVYSDALLAFIDDPNAFTGRGRLWQIAISYIQMHPWLGSGFAAFWEGGTAPPAHAFITTSDRWILTIGHTHNSYLEILVTTGIVGLVLSVIAFIILPIRRLLQFRLPYHVGALVFSWALFGIIGNITKSQFLNRDAPEWFVYVLALAIIHQAYKPTARVEAAYGGLPQRPAAQQA